jgi:hypothetical protein
MGENGEGLTPTESSTPREVRKLDLFAGKEFHVNEVGDVGTALHI